MARTRITESGQGFDRIDEEAGIIYGARVIGLTSRNRKRRYLESTLRRDYGLYEGARVYLDHARPDPKTGAIPERTIRDKWAQLKEVRFEEGGGLRADLHYLKSHPNTPMLIEAAKRFPESFGLSHDADGDEQESSDGYRDVVKIHKVYSVDIVNDPASTRGLFESEETMSTFRTIATDSKHAFAKVLQEMMGVEPPLGDLAVEASDVESEDALSAAFRAAINSVLDDTTLDVTAKLAKIRAILNAQAKAEEAVNGASASESSDMGDMEADDDEEEMTESTKTLIGNLKEQLAKVTKELNHRDEVQKCTSLLEQANREPTDVRIKALMAVEEKDRKALIESWDARKAKTRPSASPSKLYEGDASEDSYPKTPEEFRRRLA